MDFKEVKAMGEKLSKWVTYNEFNLWRIAEAGIYNDLLKDEPKFGLVDKQKHKAMRFFINVQNRKRENEKRLGGVNEAEILVVVQGISQVKTILPLLKGNHEYKVVRYDSPSDDATKKILDAQKEKYVNLESYMNDEVKKNIRKGEIWMKNSWAEIQKNADLRDLFGKRYELVMQTLEYLFKTRKRFLEIITYIELYNELYRQEKIKLVFVSDDVNAVGRLACLIARQNNIKSLDIQHGQLQGNPVGEITADKMIVNGEEDKKYLIENGGNPEQIIVTGQPRFDAMVDKLKIPREELCTKYGLDAQKKIVVYSYQKPTSGENVVVSAKDCFLENLGKIKNGENLEFAITMRPDTSIPKELERGDVKLLPGADIQELAVCSEVLITAFSTAAIEFVLMGRPVIALNIGSGPEEYVDYTRLGVGFKIVRKEDFIEAVEKTLYDKNFLEKFNTSKEEFIKNFNYKLDGKAKNRCLEVIEGMVS